MQEGTGLLERVKWREGKFVANEASKDHRIDDALPGLTASYHTPGGI